MMSSKQNNSLTLTAYAGFLVWPFFALLHALLNYRLRFAKNILWLFCAFFGYTFIISNPDMDANRYKTHLERAYAQYDIPYWDALKEPFVGKGIYSGTDIYSHFITITVGRWTDDFRIFFAIIGLVFGYFFSRNIFYILEKMPDKKIRFLSLLFLITLALLIPFWNINGYRFYTAAQVFIFGALPLIVEKKYKFLLILLLTPLIHFSFALPLLVVLIHLFTKKWIWLYLIMLAVSLFYVDLNPKTIQENYELAPIFLQNKVKGYSSKDYVKFVQKNQTGMNWYVRGHNYALQFCLYSMIIFLYIKRNRFLTNDKLRSLFSFGILLMAMANLVSSIPSMDRFYLLAGIILCASFVLIVQSAEYHRFFRNLSWLYIIPVLIFVIVEIRIGFDFIGLNALLLNPMIAPFFPDSPALIEFFK